MSNLHRVDSICDCHIHVFDKNGQKKATRYTPPAKDLNDYIQERQVEHITRAVLIQASIDGIDNSRLLNTLSSPGQLELRGVVMLDEHSSGLDKMRGQGVRGIRIQDRTRLGLNDLERLPFFSRLAASQGWHLELNTEPQRLNRLGELLRGLPEDQFVVLDHMAHCNPSNPEEIDSLLRLMESGKLWIKLSPTRVSRRIDQYDDLATLVGRLVTSHPDHCIWGSDWPHVMTQPPLPRLPSMINFLAQNLSSAQLNACLRDNPARLYGF